MCGGADLSYKSSSLPIQHINLAKVLTTLYGRALSHIVFRIVSMIENKGTVLKGLIGEELPFRSCGSSDATWTGGTDINLSPCQNVSFRRRYCFQHQLVLIIFI